MKRILLALAALACLTSGARAQVSGATPTIPGYLSLTGCPSATQTPCWLGPSQHALTASAAVTSLVAKASQGALVAYNCTAISGAAAGYCIVVNAAAAPSTGALTGVLDFCYMASGAPGCSIIRPAPIAASTGIVVLISSAATPYTYTTGTLTGAIWADYQ